MPTMRSDLWYKEIVARNISIINAIKIKIVVVVHVLLILLKRSMLKKYVLKDFLHRLKKKVSPLAIYSATQSILDYELNPLEKEASNLKKQIEKLQREILKIMEHSSDPELNLDANMIKSQLTEKQDEINKIKTVLDDITKQIELKQNESIMDIIEFSIENFEEFYHTLSDEEKKIFFHSVIKEVHVTRGEQNKRSTHKRCYLSI